jgi:magnesium chelatase family protein
VLQASKAGGYEWGRLRTPPMIQRYVSKISGPLLDRIDIHIEVPSMKYKERCAPSRGFGGGAGDCVAWQTGRAFQRRKTYCHAQMAAKLIRKHCAINAQGEKLLENAVTRLGLSARAHDRILNVARTIADLDGSTDFATKHLSEAIQYRTLDAAIGRTQIRDVEAPDFSRGSELFRARDDAT